jgi:hypothetical protein
MNVVKYLETSGPFCQFFFPKNHLNSNAFRFYCDSLSEDMCYC